MQPATWLSGVLPPGWVGHYVAPGLVAVGPAPGVAPGAAALLPLRLCRFPPLPSRLAAEVVFDLARTGATLGERWPAASRASARASASWSLRLRGTRRFEQLGPDTLSLSEEPKAAPKKAPPEKAKAKAKGLPNQGVLASASGVKACYACYYEEAT